MALTLAATIAATASAAITATASTAITATASFASGAGVAAAKSSSTSAYVSAWPPVPTLLIGSPRLSLTIAPPTCFNYYFVL